MLSVQADGFTTTMEEIGREIAEVNAANGWEEAAPEDFAGEDGNPYLIPAKIALMHSELSEALEAFRKGDAENFAEEMADAFIRIVATTHGLGIDLGAAVLAKLAKNRGRGHRHGGKRV